MKEITLKLDKNKIIDFVLGILLVTGSIVIIKLIVLPLTLVILALGDNLILMYPLLNINVQFGAIVLLVWVIFSIVVALINLIINTFKWYGEILKIKRKKTK